MTSEAAGTIARGRLHYQETDTLIAQYDRAISSHAGRHTNTGPRQRRIDYLVELLAARAEDGDPLATTWLTR